jgi:flavin-binding protein dodecin
MITQMICLIGRLSFMAGGSTRINGGNPMYASNQNEHQDVLTIVAASSKKSVDDAIQTGLAELRRGKHHQDLRFRTFEVMSIQGTICDDGQTCNADLVQVVMRVTGAHKPTP